MKRNNNTYRRKYKARPVEWPDEAIPAWLDPRSRSYLASRGISEEEAYKYQLHYCSSGYWRDRILIPMFNENGDLVAFQGRTIKSDSPKIERYLTSGPRPLYQPWTSLDQFKHKHILVIVEGPFDAFSVLRVAPAVATLGNYPSEEQLKNIFQCIEKYHFTLGVIWYDSETIVETENLFIKLSPFIRTISIDEKTVKDPGELAATDIASILERYIRPRYS